MRRIVTFLSITLLHASVPAQELPLEEAAEEEVRRYAVEIIIFSYEEEVSVGTEIFVPDEPEVVEELLLDGDPAGSEVRQPDPRADAEQPEDAEPLVRELEIVPLAEEEFTLGDVARKFELLDVYETIMHFGWVQPTYPQEETPPIALRVLGEPPEGLDGTFTLYLSRYLHLVVDLALDGPAASGSGAADAAFYDDEPLYSFGDARAQTYDDRLPESRAVRYRIQENRIVKNGELRYFDHPKFGVVAKITRIEDDEEEAEDEEREDPLVSRVG